MVPDPQDEAHDLALDPRPDGERPWNEMLGPAWLALQLDPLLFDYAIRLAPCRLPSEPATSHQRREVRLQMTYPPGWRSVGSPCAAADLMRQHPFAHLITHDAGLNCTRVPFIADMENGQVVRLRAHLNAQNPQAVGLDGRGAGRFCRLCELCLAKLGRRPRPRRHYDYEEVKVRGTIRIVSDINYFRQLIDDLASMIEPQYAEVGDYPVWQTSLAPPGYIERLFPAITAFEMKVESVEMISKLHQSFSEADRCSIADHLSRSHREDARAIAAKIKSALGH